MGDGDDNIMATMASGSKRTAESLPSMMSVSQSIAPICLRLTTEDDEPIQTNKQSCAQAQALTSGIHVLAAKFDTESKLLQSESLGTLRAHNNPSLMLFTELCANGRNTC